CQQVYSIPITF
nr:immunoglobulin light chain junction region [Macaca mulatta]MOX49751.1 immunoglobulin light chain junction region [Macaca mulatta]MOX50557.1 immunoglobulin light chain junction region [Macaca mulatta]